MKYGVLGDIHANLSALETVLACLEAAQVDVLISVGDVVGYGAAPSQCVALLREHEVVTVLGNHDAACSGRLDDGHFNPYARAAVSWTRENLDVSELEWLRELPLQVTLEHCQVAHGTIHRPELFDYLLSVTDADPSLDVLERPVGFVGHSHVPLTVMRFEDMKGKTAYSFETLVDLAQTTHAVVNAGSVGQPRDEDPRTCYVVYDSDTREVRFHRADYDIDREANRIRRAGLPAMLADRIRLGV
jgi:predicted phosphodiesterase